MSEGERYSVPDKPLLDQVPAKIVDGGPFPSTPLRFCRYMLSCELRVFTVLPVYTETIEPTGYTVLFRFVPV
jgi:hypothetical protein